LGWGTIDVLGIGGAAYGGSVPPCGGPKAIWIRTDWQSGQNAPLLQRRQQSGAAEGRPSGMTIPNGPLTKLGNIKLNSCNDGGSNSIYFLVSPSVANFLRGQADRIRQYTRKSIIQIGKDLVAAKRYLSHGAFLRWVESEVGIPVRRVEPPIAQVPLERRTRNQKIPPHPV
jgi:hypothetical protein